jgi:hypothetical protein
VYTHNTYIGEELAQEEPLTQVFGLHRELISFVKACGKLIIWCVTNVGTQVLAKPKEIIRINHSGADAHNRLT